MLDGKFEKLPVRDMDHNIAFPNPLTSCPSRTHGTPSDLVCELALYDSQPRTGGPVP